MRSAVFSVSVDDGHPHDMRLAEMLHKHDLRATFYVPVRNSEGPPVLTGAQLRQLAQQFEIGSHTLEHRYLAPLGLYDALRQIGEGKTGLQDLLGQSVQGFCYPGGKYRPLHCAMVQAAGFRYARTIQNLRFDTGEDPFEVPTTLQFYPHSRAVLFRNFLSQGDWNARQEGLALLAAERDWLKRLYLLFEHTHRSKTVFHLWCHSIDIERLGLWQQLDAFLAFVSRHIPIACRLDNGQLVARYCEGKPAPTRLS